MFTLAYHDLTDGGPHKMFQQKGPLLISLRIAKLPTRSSFRGPVLAGRYLMNTVFSVMSILRDCSANLKPKL